MEGFETEKTYKAWDMWPINFHLIIEVTGATESWLLCVHLRCLFLSGILIYVKSKILSLQKFVEISDIFSAFAFLHKQFVPKHKNVFKSCAAAA